MLIHQFFDFHCQRNPDNICLIFAGQHYSYQDIAKQSQQLAQALLAEGVSHGDRVAVLCENCPEYLSLMMACSRIGAVLVPINYRLAPAEVLYVIRDAQAKLLLAPDGKLSELVDGLRPLINELTIISSTEQGKHNWQHWLQQDIEHHTTSSNSESNTYSAFLQLYTSGTTGNPKGVVISHHNIVALYTMSQTSLPVKSGIGTRDLVCAPNFHIGGSGTLLLPILAGASVVLHSSFNPLAIVDDLEQLQIDNMFIVPAMIMAILEYVPNIEQRDFSHLKQLLYGASPISTGLLEKATRIFKCDFYQCYGMTETTGTVVSLSPADHALALKGRPELLQSCGRPLAGVEVKVINKQGEILPSGVTGELLIRSESNMQGYFNLEQANRDTVVDGWVHTGDSAMIDENGYIFLRDRMKDMVVSGGENIYPIEIENVLSTHAAVSDVAVIGIPDDKYGETPLACIVCAADQTITIEELIAFCRDKLAGFKIPRRLELYEVLPRNPSGKILKKTLREPYWKDRERNIN
ncbi:long-chain-fatty-acid--CoA ligase [Zhongshania aliphaticivorans]|uniref:long-chain-fatty-acid--CoA ligase n=1 Tax=Zhongshania aliphaticivorans TaxID=1470434 RepID=UPI0012E49127|nr:long-chain-fatty-acid--CoA ligase [Zhongshania aliphaticivorans]CAA0107574.1 Long-chain-fatty-acid--CoA ligase FadD13 [Zhongshania aliphaticivorans]